MKSLYSFAQTERILRHASECDALVCGSRGDCATDEELRGLLLEFERQLGLVRERVSAIQRETRRPGDLTLNMQTIDTMCEAILNSDFAAEIGVESTLPTREA